MLVVDSAAMKLSLPGSGCSFGSRQCNEIGADDPGKML